MKKAIRNMEPKEAFRLPSYSNILVKVKDHDPGATINFGTFQILYWNEDFEAEIIGRIGPDGRMEEI